MVKSPQYPQPATESAAHVRGLMTVLLEVEKPSKLHMQPQRPHTARALLRKDTEGGIAPLDSRSRCTACCCHGSRSRPRLWMCEPRRKPRQRGQLLRDAAAKSAQWREDVFSRRCWETWTFMCKRLKRDSWRRTRERAPCSLWVLAGTLDVTPTAASTKTKINMPGL